MHYISELVLFDPGPGQKCLAVAGTLARLCFSVNLWGLGAVNSPGTALDGNCILLNFDLFLIGQSRASAFLNRIIVFSRPYQWV